MSTPKTAILSIQAIAAITTASDEPVPRAG
jgi:hypothetical protein